MNTCWNSHNWKNTSRWIIYMNKGDIYWYWYEIYFCCVQVFLIYYRWHQLYRITDVKQNHCVYEYISIINGHIKRRKHNLMFQTQFRKNIFEYFENAFKIKWKLEFPQKNGRYQWLQRLFLRILQKSRRISIFSKILS